MTVRPRQRRGIGAPLWLAAPSRFRGWSRRAAATALALVAVLLLACMAASTRQHATEQDGAMAAIVVNSALVDGLRHGGDYYGVAADALRANEVPLRRFQTVRLPTLTVAEAALPRWIVPALGWLLVAAVVGAWTLRLVSAFGHRPARLVALVLLVAGCLGYAQGGVFLLQEGWAGLLVALSLALRRPHHWVDAVALGTTAALIDETAAIYLLIMAAFAWRERSKREASGWLAALLIVAAAAFLHLRSLDNGSLGATAAAWSGAIAPEQLLAFGAVATLPAWLSSLLVVLMLAGWFGWRDPLGARTAATLGALSLLALVERRQDFGAPALLVAPLLPAGLAMIPDAIRDLVAAAAALDRRRITVRAVTP